MILRADLPTTTHHLRIHGGVVVWAQQSADTFADSDNKAPEKPLPRTPRARLERATCGLEVRCSIQLSYRG
jgi:hypothetical protein